MKWKTKEAAKKAKRRKTKNQKEKFNFIDSIRE